MAYTLTTEQRIDLTSDLGIPDDETVFSDAELNRHYTRGSGNFKKAYVYALRQIVMDPVRFDRYAGCFVGKDRTELMKMLEKRLTAAEKDAGMSGGSLSTGTMRLGLDQADPSTDDGTYPRDF